MKKNGVYQGIKNSMINVAGNIIRKMSLATGAVLATVAAAGLAMALSGTDIVYADDNGFDGGIKWTISGNTLTIEPAGEDATDGIENGVMKNYNSFPTDSTGGKTPWGQSAEYGNVEKIIVKNGVTSIGNKAFGNSKSERKVYDSVVIKSDVGSIGKYAFCNSTINNIEFHGLGLQSGNIDPTAFVSSSDEDSDWHINIGNLSCYKKTGEVCSYFSVFNENDFTVGSKTVKQSSINITYYNVVVSSTDLLGTDDKVYAQFTGADEIEADTTGSNVPSEAVLRDFVENHNYDVTKLKLFNIVMSDSNGSIDEVTIRVPVSDMWRETGSIKLLEYYENSEGAIAEVSGTTIVTDNNKKFLSFTTKQYRTYALYYDYNENPQTEISITTDFFQGVFQWNINNGSATLATPTSAAATEAYNKFVSVNDSKYKLDAVHLRVFDISAKIDGAEQSSKIENLKVRIPVPSEWESYASSVKVITIKDANTIEEVEGVEVKTVDGKKYLEFTPPHFSPYALYYANAGETPTTQPTTSAQQPTTSNGNGNNNNSTTSYTQATTKALGGSLDNTPNTGVKDVMWILIPAATLLLGVGIVVLARRKKNINDNY